MSKEKDATEEVVENETDEQETENEETLFDVVSAAIDEETIEPEGADGDPDGDDSGDENDDTPVDEEGNEGEADEVDSDDEDGNEGTGEESSDDDEPAEDDPAAEAEGAEGEEGDAEPDPINDPIPDELKEGTKERIQTLIGRAKDGEEAAAERDDFVSMVTSTGADAEQFSATLGWLTLYNSAKLEDRRKALTIMKQAVDGLAGEIGEPVIGASALEQHADLAAEVEEGTLTQERAEEIAQGRNRQAAETRLTEQSNTETEQQRRADAAVAQGKADLNALEVALKASDPRYVEKKAVLVPALQQMMRTIHPSEWKATFQQAYDRLQLPTAPATPKPKPKAPENDDSHEPLRPKQPAGKGAKEPTTMEQAIDAALDNMGN